MLFVVVSRAIASIVVLPLFASTAALVLPPGTLAPPYHLNRSFYCDYFGQSSGAHYVRRGGRCTNGFNCGFTYISLGDGFGTANWYTGAALSFKTLLFIVIILLNVVVQIIVFVVVDLMMVLFVEFSILLFTTAQVLLVGVLALPYHLN